MHPDDPQNVFKDRFLFIPVTADTNNQNKTVRRKCKNMRIDINVKNNKDTHLEKFYHFFKAVIILTLKKKNYLFCSATEVCWSHTIDHYHL